MSGKNRNITLSSYEELFQTDQQRQDKEQERVQKLQVNGGICLRRREGEAGHNQNGEYGSFHGEDDTKYVWWCKLSLILV